ncbi:MAG: DUF721 domain-containing protein [Planctomycetes bacterium]|nr:DUF721 domain-containing protein [Planctomycetota bacterium]
MAARKRPYSEPEAISAFLPKVLREIRPPRRGALEQLRAAWVAAAGEAAARGTKVVSCESGTLHVKVTSAALRHHLATFRNEELLKALGEALPAARIRSIRYRIGG